MTLKLTDLLLADLEREAVASRKVLARVPLDHPDWKPHPKSMELGYLSVLVATMPGWLDLIEGQDEFDLMPGGKPRERAPQPGSTKELQELLDKSVAQGRAALERTSDEKLMKNWKLLVAGRVVDDRPRYIVIRETFTHLAHHRGQLTVYLRLTGALVPAVYGPSADEGF